MNTELSFIVYNTNYGEQIVTCRNDPTISVKDSADLCDNPYKFGYAMGLEGRDFHCSYDPFSWRYADYERGYDNGKFEFMKKVAE